MKDRIFGLIFTVVLSITPKVASGCPCEFTATHEYYQSAEFIARVQIVSMTKDDNNPGFHTAEIKVLELFKGEKRDSLSVFTGHGGGGGCSIWTEPGTEWLIVGQKYSGLIQISYCQGSKKLLPEGSLNTSFAKGEIKIYRTLKTKLGNPDFLGPKKNRIYINNHAFDKFKGINMPDETVAIYLANFNEVGNLIKLEALHEFKNQSVATSLKETLEKQLYLKPYSGEVNEAPISRQLLVAIYYMPSSVGRPSSFSLYN